MSTYGQTGPAVALAKCFFCLEAGDLLLQTRNIRFKDQRIERMNGAVIHMQPCAKCKGYMQQGVILITIDDAKSTPGWNKPRDGEERFIPNPYRTGGFFVVKAEAFQRMFNDVTADGPSGPVAFGLRHRWMFIEHDAAKKIGLFAAVPTTTKTP